MSTGHEHLWAGPDLKQEHARFHLNAMRHALAPADWTGSEIAMRYAGRITDRGQERRLYAHLDAFLAATHAVPWIIQCCFGHDSNHRLASWFRTLSQDEQCRRKRFSKMFSSHLTAFLKLPLSVTRNASEHRVGYPDVEARCTSRFGVTYIGGPAQHIPIADMRPIANPQSLVMAAASPELLELREADVTIDTRPVLDVCEDYLREAAELTARARQIDQRVHGTKGLTTPPDI